jgi:PHD/YefM family antitoxin component YafN of YafNO toxin-antitoxin module
MKTQFITDNNGHKLAVILPIKDYNKMIEELEDLEDIKAYDNAKKGKQEFNDAKQVFIEIEESRKQA